MKPLPNPNPCPACGEPMTAVAPGTMPTAMTLSDIQITPATGQHARAGILFFISCRYGDLVLDGLFVRRTLEGLEVLGFPARRDRHGNQHFYIKPTDLAARATLEAAIRAALPSEAFR